MPPASNPSASRRCAWPSCSSSAFRSLMSTTNPCWATARPSASRTSVHVVEHPDDPPVCPDHPILALHVLRKAPLIQLRVDLAIVRMDELRREARLVEPPLHRIAEERLGLRALEERRDGQVDQAAQVGDERQPVDDAAMPLLCLAQSRRALTPRLLEPDEHQPGEPEHDEERVESDRAPPELAGRRTDRGRLRCSRRRSAR